MGAGNASATLYNCDPNIPTGGGNKKQGITSRVGLDNWSNREIQTQSNGIGRFKLFFTNQLSGIEQGHSMFGGRYNRGDGLNNNLYQLQLKEIIKQDKQTNIYPGNDHVYRQRRLGSTSCTYSPKGSTPEELNLNSSTNGYTIFTTSAIIINCYTGNSPTTYKTTMSINNQPYCNVNYYFEYLNYNINNDPQRYYIYIQKLDNNDIQSLQMTYNNTSKDWMDFTYTKNNLNSST